MFANIINFTDINEILSDSNLSTQAIKSYEKLGNDKNSSNLLEVRVFNTLSKQYNENKIMDNSCVFSIKIKDRFKNHIDEIYKLFNTDLEINKITGNYLNPKVREYNENHSGTDNLLYFNRIIY